MPLLPLGTAKQAQKEIIPEEAQSRKGSIRVHTGGVVSVRS